MSRESATITLCYALLLSLCGLAYYRLPTYREDLKFWIPQVLLLVLITVTTLYVVHTAKLVEETRRLQQRPFLSISFHETQEVPTHRLAETFARAEGLLKGVVRAVGGAELRVPRKFLVIRVRNIGQLTLREVNIAVAFVGPDGQFDESFSLMQDTPPDKHLDIGVAPAALPWMAVELRGVVYGDGLRKYTEFSGSPRFEKRVEASAFIPSNEPRQVTEPRVERPQPTLSLAGVEPATVEAIKKAIYSQSKFLGAFVDNVSGWERRGQELVLWFSPVNRSLSEMLGTKQHQEIQMIISQILGEPVKVTVRVV